jgi:hypothetical protein
VCDPNNGQCTQVSVAPGQACTGAADDCNLGICDANAVCQAIPTNEGGVCDDGSSCTSGTTCASGVCQGGSSNITVFFGEDFASNAAGWTLDGEWQIGSALASMGGTGNPDPGQDHTPTADNGVAGVVIGGNAATNMHPYHYLTSPPFNASGQPVVFLQFERWLNSDYTPYMQNRVEVFDGSTWVTIWESGPQPPIFDNAWMPQTFDVSAHANANMRVRFGFTIGQAGVYTVSQWNVDDILLADGTCP